MRPPTVNAARAAGIAARLSTRYLTAGLVVALVGSVLAYTATAGRLHDGGVLTGLDVRTWGAALGMRVGLEDALQRKANKEEPTTA